jgi:hypothetical protein
MNKCTLIKSKLTSFLSKSATAYTASTHISASLLLFYETTLDPKEVMAASINLSLSSLLNSTFSA